jgi:hypothetical protein
MKRVEAWNRIKLSVGLSMFGVAATAAAQQPSQAQVGAIKQSCRTDYQSFCSGVPTGGSAALQCLQGHISSLSPPCQTAVGAATGGGAAHLPTQASQAAPPNTASSAAPPPAMSMRNEAMRW